MAKEPLKLYEVSIEITGYVVATSELNAQMLADDVLCDFSAVQHAEALEVTSHLHPIAGGWDLDCLVYGAPEDQTLEQWWPVAPEPKVPPVPPALFPDLPLLPKPAQPA